MNKYSPENERIKVAVIDRRPTDPKFNKRRLQLISMEIALATEIAGLTASTFYFLNADNWALAIPTGTFTHFSIFAGSYLLERYKKLKQII